jgi:predicted MPP superfamily phosphohydrolase
MFMLKIGFCAVFLHEFESHFYSSLLVFSSFILFHISDIHSRVLLYFLKCVKHLVFLNAVGLLPLRFSWIIRYDLVVAMNDSIYSLFVT